MTVITVVYIQNTHIKLMSVFSSATQIFFYKRAYWIRKWNYV